MKKLTELKENIRTKYEAFRNNKKLQKIIKAVASAVVTLAVVILTCISLSKMDFSTIAHVTFDWRLAVVALLLFIINPFFKAANMAFGYAKGEIPFSDAIRIVIIGNGLNLILPFKLGEGIRLSLYPKGMTVSSRTRLYGIGLFFDAAMVFLFLLLAAIFILPQNNYILDDIRFADFWLPAFLIIIAIMAIAAFLCFIIRPAREKLLPIFTEGKWLPSLIFIFLCYLSNFASITVTLSAFSNLSVWQCLAIALCVIVFINLAIIIPSTPGQLGLFELSVILSFAAVGLTPEQGLVAGLIIHLIQYIGLLPLSGILYFFVKKKNNAPSQDGTDALVTEENK